MIGQARISKESMPNRTETAHETADALDAKLKKAVDDARVAGVAAAQEFVRTAHRNAQGQVAGSCGRASVKVSKPSYQFRESLKRLQPHASGFRASWRVLSFGDELGLAIAQNIDVHEIACIAAKNFIATHFPDESFWVDSYID